MNTVWRGLAVGLSSAMLLAVAAEGQEATYFGRTVSEWIEDLGSDDWQSRVSAAWALSEIGPPAAEAIPSLLRTIGDENANLRLLAAQALGAIGQATEVVTAALRKAADGDPDADVRDTAGWALRQLNAGSEVPDAEGPPPAPPVAPPDGAPPPPDQENTIPYEPVWAADEAHIAVKDAALKSYSLGLVDQEGSQLNPNVSADAPSLTPDDLGAHSALAAIGSYRTVAAVVNFLAAFDMRLAATGEAITVEDLLPDLQEYVTWSFAHQDDPRSGLGIVLGSGPFLEVPEEPPAMSERTPISSIAALLMLSDMVIGVPQDTGERGWGQTWPVPQGAVRLAGLGDIRPYLRAGPADPQAAALHKIRGLITEIELDPNFVDMMFGSRERWQVLPNLLALFECQNRLTVTLAEPIAQTTIAVRSLRAQRRGEEWWMRSSQDYRKTPTVPLIADVGFVSAQGHLIRLPAPRLKYVARLWAFDAEPAAYRDLELADGLVPDTVPSRAKFWLGNMFLSRFTALRGDGHKAGLVPAADAHLAAREPDGSSVPRGYRIESTGTTLPFNVTVSTVPGQAVPTQSPFGIAFLQVGADFGVADFFEFWMRYVEPLRMVGLTPAEDDAFVRLATDKVLEITPARCPIIFESKQEETSLKAVDLLGDYTLAPGGRPQWAVHMHLKVGGDGGISGLCSLQDNRETEKWMWLQNLGQFSGRMKVDSEGRRQGAGGTDDQRRLRLGDFEATGTWRGVKRPAGDTEHTIVKGLTGAVRVRGRLLQGEQGYEAEGEVDFYGAEDWLRWQATEDIWRVGLKEKQEFEKEYGLKSPFPRWEHPDWLEEE